MPARKGDTQKTKKDLIVELLREIILSGELVPGERLMQEELAERFEVSPTPIREAIQQLVAEGVLSHSPYRGVQVAEVQLEDAQEVYLIRSVLEELATRIGVPFLRITDVKRLHALHDEIKKQVADNDLLPLRKLNYEFHMLIYERSEMPQLLHIIRTLWTKFPWDTLHVLPNRAAQSVTEHDVVLNAIDAGDADAAAVAVRHHIESGSVALKEYLSKPG